MVLDKSRHAIFLLLSLLTLLFTFCKAKEEEKPAIPSYVLTEEVFIKVTCDLALAESAANLNIKNIGAHQMDSAYAFNPFKDNTIQKKDYDTSVHFYSKHPKLYKKLLDEALNRLSVIQSNRQAQ